MAEHEPAKILQLPSFHRSWANIKRLGNGFRAQMMKSLGIQPPAPAAPVEPPKPASVVAEEKRPGKEKQPNRATAA